jgi:two-component system sensor histidine kinase MprB
VSRYSIRRRLPLSYAAVALLATLALGSVLLLTLRAHYLRVEREYLQSNAQAIGSSLAQLLEDDPSRELLQSQLDSLAFLSSTRVSFFDASKQLVAISEPAGRVAISVAAGEAAEFWLPEVRILAPIRAGGVPTATFSTEDGAIFWLPAEGLRRLPAQEGERRIFPLVEEGAWRRAQSEANDSYSSQVVRVPVLSSAEQLLGYAELSQGPAYAREIVADVAWGLAIAGVVAVALAGVVGRAISRRISAPLVALTEVTAAMAEGSLAVRADVARQDELGTLALSFNQMADRVEEIVTTLRRFVSDAAHEIHTPLTALRTNLELARQDTEPGTEEYVSQAQAQAERLEALTGGLLDLSRLESPAQAPKLLPLSLLPLLNELGELYASRAEQAGLVFEWSLPEAPVSVLGEEAQLRAALTNLLDNALKFTPEGGSICLGCRQEGGAAVLWVEDTGAGLAEADLPHLFERFYRGRNAAASPGSGLGLAIVKAVVERHGGQVRAERTEQGARFTIIIPCIQSGIRDTNYSAAKGSLDT